MEICGEVARSLGRSVARSPGCLGALLGLVGLATPSTLEAASRALVTTAASTFTYPDTVPIGSSRRFATSSPDGVDPVLHIFGFDASGGLVPLASLDDTVGIDGSVDRDPDLQWQNNSAYSQILVVVRSYASGTAGTSAFLVNNVEAFPAIAVGGTRLDAAEWTSATGDAMHALPAPGGSTWLFLMPVAADRVTALAGAMGNAVGGAAQVSAPANAGWYVVATPQIGWLGALITMRAGLAYLAANDVASADSDQDGVGDGLEAAMQTCPSPQCANSPHGRDTDRDGLADSEEIFGVAGTLPTGADDLALPRWGANPRHKDVFVEVDHLYAYQTAANPPLATGENPFAWIRDHPGAPLGSWTGGTVEQWVAAVRAPYLSGPNGHLHNPDGADGVEVHLDLGVNPLPGNESAEAQFGDYGASSLRAVVEDFILRFDAPVTGQVAVQINDSVRSFDASGLGVSDLCWAVAAEVALMMWLDQEPVTFKTLACDAQGGPRLVVATQDEALYFGRDVLVPPGFAGSIVVEREGAEDLREHRLLTETRAGNRKGTMRYAVISELVQDGQARYDAPVTQMSPQTFAHELGHTLDLQHHGHDEWGTKSFSCIPHYLSLMSYAPTSAFSAVEDTLTLLPHATVETNTLGAGFPYSLYGNAPYLYQTPPPTATGVDWNRDGVQDDATVGHRSFALHARDRECNTFSSGITPLAIGSAGFTGAPDLVRHGNRLYALWSSANASLMTTFAPLGAVGNKGCTGNANPHDELDPTPCLTFGATVSLGSLGASSGVSALSVGNTLVVASAPPSGSQDPRMQVWTLVADAAGALDHVATAWSPTSPNPDGAGSWPTYGTNHPVELVRRHAAAAGSAMTLLYLNKNGQFSSFGWNGAGLSYEGPLLDANGTPITGGQAPVARSWPDPDLDWSPNEFKTLAVLPAPGNGRVRLYRLDYASNRWHLLVDGADMPGANAAAKPFLDVRLARDSSGVPDIWYSGHLMLGWLAPTQPAGPVPYVWFSDLVARFAPPGDAGAGQLGLLPVHDTLKGTFSSAPSGSAVATYADRTTDNVFGLQPLTGSGGQAPTLNFLPHADGAPATPLKVRSDFRVMEDGICRRIAVQRAPPFDCGAIDVMD